MKSLSYSELKKANLTIGSALNNDGMTQMDVYKHGINLLPHMFLQYQLNFILRSASRFIKLYLEPRDKGRMRYGLVIQRTTRSGYVQQIDIQKTVPAKQLQFPLQYQG